MATPEGTLSHADQELDPIERVPVPTDAFTLRDEANALTAHAFRNGFLEDLHAGKPRPSSTSQATAESRMTK